MKIQTKPQNIGTFDDGNSTWDDYKFQNEMLQIYEDKRDSGNESERVVKRIEQYTIQVQLAEGRLIKFCQKNNITIQ